MARICSDAVGTHHEDVVGPLEFLHRPLGDHDRVLACRDGKPHPAELSRPEEPPGIGERGLERQGAGLGIDSPSDDRDPALLRVHRSVGENQLELRPRAAALARLRLGGPRVGEVLGFGDGEVEPHGIEGGHHREHRRLRAPDIRPDIHLAVAGQAGDGAGHAGVAEVELGRGELRLGGRHGWPGWLPRRPRHCRGPAGSPRCRPPAA